MQTRIPDRTHRVRCANAVRTQYRRGNRGFTLIEAMVALIMFAVIMGALSFAFNTVMRTQSSAESNQEDNGAVRVIFDSLKRDIQAGFVSANDPSSVFIGGGASSGSGNNAVTSPGLLTLSTTSYRIQADELNSASTVNTTSSLSGGVAQTPQSGAQLVRYDLDSTTNDLTRSVVNVPNPQLVSQPTPGDPTTIIGKHITSITFQYWDPTQSSWRDTWDYEQPNLAASMAANPSSAGTTAAAAPAAATPSTAGQSSTTGNSNGDVTFPSAVQVTIVLSDSSGRQRTYKTEFTVAAASPFIDPTTSAGGTGATGAAAPATGQ